MSVWSVVHLFLLPPPSLLLGFVRCHQRMTAGGNSLPPCLPSFLSSSLPSVWPRVSLSVSQCSYWLVPSSCSSAPSSSLNQTLVCLQGNCLPVAHHFPGCAPLNISTRHYRAAKRKRPRLRECSRQVEAEVVSNSSNKIHQTWEPLFWRPL